MSTTLSPTPGDRKSSFQAEAPPRSVAHPYTGKDRQGTIRARLYAAHRDLTLNLLWDAEGNPIGKNPGIPDLGGYRGLLWQSYSWLASDKVDDVAKANRIILRHHTTRHCHFAPGAAVDVLSHYADKLSPEVRELLTGFLCESLPWHTTEDLKIHGYNDNHPYKAFYTLIVGGELIGAPVMVEKGLRRLREACEVFRRTGFPCEYSSPNYTPVSLQPLAALAGLAGNEEARDLALRLEHFYWQDLALHFDSSAGVPTGPFSRAGANDAGGLLGGTLSLLAHLFPERFSFDLIEEIYKHPESSKLISPGTRQRLSFYQAHPIWYARSDYHLTPALEEAIFHKPTGTYVRGITETGTHSLTWNTEDERPLGSPTEIIYGPRNSLITTFYGQDFSLGTSQHAWLDNAQAHGFYATLARQPRKPGNIPTALSPTRAAVYYARHFTDENYPFRAGVTITPDFDEAFYERGEIRTVQHKNTALVFYTPRPTHTRVKSIRTGIFRPLAFSRPRQLFVGDVEVPHLNHTHSELAPVAIDEDTHYVGIVPLPLSTHAGVEQCRRALIEVHTYLGHLSILLSSRAHWTPRRLSLQEFWETHAGFAFEIHSAADFDHDFVAFRHWLSEVRIEDNYHAHMRTTTYARPDLTLSASYCPQTSAFRYVSINGDPLARPTFEIQGMADPGHAFCRNHPQ